MITAFGKICQSNLVRKSFLKLLNNFVREVERTSPGYGLHVEFSKRVQEKD